jgi:hypothetical protein
VSTTVTPSLPPDLFSSVSNWLFSVSWSKAAWADTEQPVAAISNMPVRLPLKFIILHYLILALVKSWDLLSHAEKMHPLNYLPQNKSISL